MPKKKNYIQATKRPVKLSTNSQILNALDECSDCSSLSEDGETITRSLNLENEPVNVQEQSIGDIHIGTLDEVMENNNSIEIEIVEHSGSLIDAATNLEESDYNLNHGESDNPGPSKRRKTISLVKQKARAGRKDDSLWNEFSYSKDSNGKRINLECKKCDYKTKFAKVERLREHLQKCGNVKNAKVDSSRNLQFSKEPVASLTPESVEWLHTRDHEQKSYKPMVQGNLDVILKESAAFKTKLDDQVGRFIFGANLSFQTVNHSEFVKLVKMLRPSYSPPTSRVIGSTILDKTYEKMKSEAKSELEGKYVTIMQDGWTATSSSPVISHCLSIEGKKTFHLNAVPTTTNKKTADYCLTLLEEAIEISETDYGCIVGGLVTDNCNTMLSLQRKIRTKKPNFFAYGCSTHLLNLIGKDMTKPEVIEKVKSIQHFFKDHDYTRENLRKSGWLQPVLPCDTRWNSQFACLKNYLLNYPKYIEIGNDENSKTPPAVLKNLMDLDFLNEVKTATANMQPIVEAIEKLQNEGATISYAVKHWIKVSSHSILQPGLEEKLKPRMDLALTPFACAAYLLHPKYRGFGLPRDYLQRGQDFLTSIQPLYLAAQMKLSLNDDKFYYKNLMDKSILKGTQGLSAAQWWKQMGDVMGTELPQGLANLAEHLMMLPASTSGIERSFSTLGSIMTDVRNRIGVEKASKLCLINQTINSAKKLFNAI